jgi:hypothetical protein
VKVDIRFQVDRRDYVTLPDGSRELFGAVIVAPEKWAGQVRDILLRPDGSVGFGPDLNRIPRSLSTTTQEPTP